MTDKTLIWLFIAAVWSFGQAIFGHFRILASHWLTGLDPCWLAQGLAGGGGGCTKLTPQPLGCKIFQGKTIHYIGGICETASFIGRHRIYTDSHTWPFTQILNFHRLHTWPFTQILNFHVHVVSLMGEPEQCSPPVWPSSQRVNDGKNNIHTLSDSYPAFFLLIATTSNKKFLKVHKL